MMGRKTFYAMAMTVGLVLISAPVNAGQPGDQYEVVTQSSFVAFDGCWLNKTWLLLPYKFYCQSRFDTVALGPATLYVQRGLVFGPVRPGMLCLANGACIPGGVGQL